MGGRKRSRNDCDNQEIMLKLKRLEKEVLKKRRFYSSESGESESDGDYYPEYDNPPFEEADDDASLVDERMSPQPVLAARARSDGSPPAAAAPAPAPAASPAPPASPARPASPVLPAPRAKPAPKPAEVEHVDDDPVELDQVILDILGDDPTAEKSYGEDLQRDVASRWKHILVNGLDKEKRAALVKKYLPSENCTSMKAPKLNLEVKAALTEINTKKDIYSQSKQSQLTSCLAALGKALSATLNKNANIPQEIIQSISDAGRLLCDYHHKESLSRRYSAMNTLPKETRDMLKNTKIDEFLFGSDLAELLKSSKAVSKSGSEMKQPAAGPSNLRSKQPATMTSRPPAARRAPTLNARGAPRAPAAEPRANPAPRRPPTPRRVSSASAGAAARRAPPPRYRSRRT